jgi:hypothetical protein
MTGYCDSVNREIILGWFYVGNSLLDIMKVVVLSAHHVKFQHNQIKIVGIF